MAREDPILIPGEKVKETLRKFREMHFRMVSCFVCMCWQLLRQELAEQDRVLLSEKGYTRRNCSAYGTRDNSHQRP